MDSQLSNTIHILKAPLIIGVVMIHVFSPFLFRGSGAINDFPIYETMGDILAGSMLSRVRMPLFFFISGLLFFTKIFSLEQYKKNIKSRMRTLLIPYVFWNILFIVLFCMGHYGPKDYVIAFIKPVNYPFWFIRDLIVICLLSPIVYVVCKYAKKVGLVLLFLLTITFPKAELSVPFLFFGLGAYFSINQVDLLSVLNKLFIPLAIFYPLSVGIGFLSSEWFWHYRMNLLFSITDVFFFFALASKITNNTLKKQLFATEKYAFLIFAFHVIPISYLRICFFDHVPISSEGWMVALFFIVTLFVILCSVALFHLLNKLCPIFLKLITGNRIQGKV